MLDSNYTEAFRKRGFARFYLAQFVLAQEDLNKVVEESPSDPYGALWLYLARARAGQDGKEELAKNTERLKDDGISEHLIALFLGKTSPKEFASAVRNLEPQKREQYLCEARFYLRQDTLLHGAQPEATKLFSAAEQTGPFISIEYLGALTELKRLR